jgi:hypothetical protein
MAGRAPYQASVKEFVKKFRFSKWRCDVLSGFLALRRKYFLAGVRNGFQWVDGSFAADVKPEPGDIDVVTFYKHHDQDLLIHKLKHYGVDVTISGLVKAVYHCDSYLINMSDYESCGLIATSSYWYSLFSHTRDRQWKGLVQLPLLVTSRDALNEYNLQKLLSEGV